MPVQTTAERFKAYVEERTRLPYPEAYRLLLGPRLAALWAQFCEDHDEPQ